MPPPFEDVIPLGATPEPPLDTVLGGVPADGLEHAASARQDKAAAAAKVKDFIVALR